MAGAVCCNDVALLERIAVPEVNEYEADKEMFRRDASTVREVRETVLR